MAAELSIEWEFVKHLAFSASSGLVKVDDRFYTVSDDQLALEIFTDDVSEPSHFYQLFPGLLPDETKARKLAKPDLEALVFLPQDLFMDHGALLAIPSGSTSNRCRAALVPFVSTSSGARASLLASPTLVDLAGLYSVLQKQIPDLNIEGAAISEDHCHLFQRGNGAGAINAVIDLDLGRFLHQLSANTITEKCLVKINPVKLPQIHEAPLGFTDAVFVAGEMWFLAAAEKTTSTFDDGPFAGAILGKLNESYQVTAQATLPFSHKPEGLWLDPNNAGQFYVVTDADDPATPSSFYRGHWLRNP